MEKDRKIVLLVIVGVLLVIVVGVTFAYFVASTFGGGPGVTTSVKTSDIAGTQVKVEGSLDFNDLDILPGHKNVSKLKVTATGSSQLVNYKLVWEGTNTLNTTLKYYVYRSSSDATPKEVCTKKQELISIGTMHYETCEETGFENLGEVIASGDITTTSVKREFTLIDNEVVSCSEEGNVIYYYVVLEYPNLDESQNIDMGGSFDGVVNIKENKEEVADLNISNIYVNNASVDSIPSKDEGYTFNQANSTCTNGASLEWDSEAWSLKVSNLTRSGTDCNLYFN